MRKIDPYYFAIYDVIGVPPLGIRKDKQPWVIELMGDYLNKLYIFDNWRKHISWFNSDRWYYGQAIRNLKIITKRRISTENLKLTENIRRDQIKMMASRLPIPDRQLFND